MNDYTKMIEHIKLSEIRVAAVAKEIKEFEESIKKLDEELQIIKSKEKQVSEELEYKRKIVTEKEWEVAGLERELRTWEEMLKEKKATIESEMDELESMQNKVWNTRRAFHNRTADFVAKNNILDDFDKKIEILMEKKEEKNNLLTSVELLDQKVNNIEKIHSELKANCDLMQHLEKERETLLEYEYSPEVLRLQNKIAACTRELESLEKDLSRYSERAVMSPQELRMVQNFKGGPPEILQTQLCRDELTRTASSSHVTKQSFKPRLPSYLLARSFPQDQNSSNAN